MSSISIDGVSKRYGNLTTVDNVSLDIREGEFLAFLGPSGCGKTTTLRMIAGLTEVSEGAILFGERDVTALPPYLRNAGLVFQGYALFPHMSVTQNVAFGLEMRKTGKAEAQERVMRALALVKLDHLAERMPKQLSGGQQQRVALARAIVYQPDVLLLDEPLSALDAKLRHEVRGDLRRLQSDLGLTTVFVTHDQDEALSVADRIVVMSAGRIEQVGAPREIYQNPASRFVAEFIGFTNVFPGGLDTAGRFRTAGGESFAVASEGGKGRDVSAFAVRPEQIVLRREVTEGRPESSLSAKVEDVIYRGALTEFIVRTETGMPLVVHRQNSEGGREEEFRAGDRVVASWPAAATMLF